MVRSTCRWHEESADMYQPLTLRKIKTG